MKRNRIMVNLTWKCSLGNCEHCWVNQVVRGTELAEQPDIHWKKWQKALNTMPPSEFDMLGGEPTVFKGFFELVKGLDKKHLWSLTTNLVNFDERKYKQLDPKRCHSITVSYHPESGISADEFVSHLNVLQKQGFNISVNIVLHHSTVDSIIETANMFAIHKIPLYISPYEHPADLHIRDETLQCNGGKNHFVFNNNGDVYRCLSWLRSNHRKAGLLGNIFDGTFKSLEQRSNCNLFCEMKHVVSDTNTMKQELNIIEV